MNKKILFMTTFLLTFSSIVVAEEYKTQPSSAEFEQIKKLAGVWQGTSTDDGKDEKPAKVEYMVTSGGSAVVEKLFSGTPHEMVSVYHDQNGKLSMTHYCMLGNQPKMTLTGANQNSIELEFANNQNVIDVNKEMHMHGLKLSFIDQNNLTQNWVLYQNGKKKSVTTITLKRIQ